MNEAQKKAIANYELWCEAGHPGRESSMTVPEALQLAIGYVLNVTDGRPDDDERALLALLADLQRTP
jgi:hypothetical protein